MNDKQTGGSPAFGEPLFRNILFTGEININKNMLEKSTKMFGEGDSQSKLYLQSTPYFFNVKKQFDKNTNNNYFKNKVDYIAR